MKIVKKDDLNKINFSSGVFQSTLKIFDMCKDMEVGDACVIDSMDWPAINLPTSLMIENIFKKHGVERKFRMRSLEAKKGWAFIRTL